MVSMKRADDENEDKKAEALLDDIEAHMYELIFDHIGHNETELEEGECTSGDEDVDDTVGQNINNSLAQPQVGAKANEYETKEIRQRLKRHAFEPNSHSDIDKIDVNYDTGRYSWERDDELDNASDKSSSDEKVSPIMDLPVTELFCNLCGERFDSYQCLEKHVLLSKNNHSLLCRSCGKGNMPSLVVLYSHARKCTNWSSFELAERNYTKANPEYIQYHCDFCNKAFAVLQDFLLHKSNVHKREFLPCPICSLRFSNWNRLFFHMQQHALIGNVDLRCKLCPFRFYIPWTFQTHISTIHNQQGPQDVLYQCCLCPALFINDMSAFITHVHRHGNYFKMEDIKWDKVNVINGRPLLFPGSVQCATCAMVFSTGAELTVHEKMGHQELTNLILARKKKNDERKLLLHKIKGLRNRSTGPISKGNMFCSVCKIHIFRHEFDKHRKTHRSAL